MEQTGSNAASENGKVERPNGTFGAMVRCLLYRAILIVMFWSSALVHAFYLKNRLYHKALQQTQCKAWTGNKPPLAHLRTFGALVTARKPGKWPVKADRHTAHGILLGYGATPKHVRYFDLTKNHEKLSTYNIMYESHYGKTHRPPGPQIFMYMGYELPPLIPAIVTPSPLLQYLICSIHKPVMTFYSKLLPLPMNEFTSDPVAVVTALITSHIDRNNSVTVTFSTEPFDPSFPENILVSVIHPTLGLDLHYDVDRHHCRLIKMDPGTPSH
jgi:hypothetical protein